VTRTHEQRITDLESDGYRTGHRLDRFSAGIKHLTNAVGDLSQGQRALALDVREIRQDVTEIRQDVTEIKATQHEHSTILREHGELLRAILDRLGPAR